MENAIKFLRIQNFKSIKDVTLHPRRVNLIIGEPNVGKSNLLEAMTLLGGITYEQTGKFMGSFIRYEEPRQLFYDNLVGNTIKVETDKDVAILLFDSKVKQFKYLFSDSSFYKELARDTKIAAEENWFSVKEEFVAMRNAPRNFREITDSKYSSRAKFIRTEFDNHGITVIRIDNDDDRRIFQLISNADMPPKPYSFHRNTPVNNDSGDDYLSPPNGNNLVEVIQTLPKLRKEIAAMFERYGQKLQLRMDERRIEIIKDQDGIIYSYPYSSVADTLQRIIFYLAAIESNDDAVLLFEEPEAHSFPVYVSKLGRRIVESTNNQFFIDTHSPYLVDEILETMLTDDEQAGQLAIFAAYYEDHQTKVHQLSDEEIRSIRNDSIDVFYNMKRFTTGAAHNA